MLTIGAIIGISSGLGYALPAIIGLESMGIPSPGETALVLAAVLASQGKLNIVLVIAIGIASAIIGDNLGYTLGRVLERPGPFHHRRLQLIARGDRFFAKHGPKAVFFGRWLALIRFATAWLAGINDMRFLTFFAWNAVGGITWGLTYGLAGYFGGEAFTKVLESIGLVAAIVLAVVVVGGFVLVRVRERRAGRRLDESPDLPERCPR